jgi:hypothetical protein
MQEIKMEQKVKERLAKTHTKTMFYIAYAFVWFAGLTVPFILSQVIMGQAWTQKHDVYVISVGALVATVLTMVLEKRMLMRAEK